MSELNVFGLREYSRHDLFVDTTDAIREADRFYIMTEADVVLKDQEELITKKDMEISNLKAELSYIKADSAFDRDKYEELLKSKDEEICRLKRALYKACANWAICKACILEYFCHILNAKKWERMYHKCRVKAEQYK